MKGFKLMMLAVLVLTVAGLGQAATIALVSDAYAPGENPTGDHNDDTFVAFLEGLGYTVDTSGMGEASRGGPLQSAADADLVIVSRRTNSGAYDDGGEVKAWNELGTPLILMSGYLTRNTRWGWTTGGSGDSKDENGLHTLTDLDIIGAHPFLPVPQVFDWSLSPKAPGAPKSIYLPNSSGDVVPSGIVIAEYGEDRPFLIDYEAGTDFDAGNGTTDKYGVAGARRAFMGHWGYDDGVTGTNGSDGGPADWEDYITDDYKDIFAGTVATMIPEPATLVLLGLGGLLLRRRR